MNGMYRLMRKITLTNDHPLGQIKATSKSSVKK